MVDNAFANFETSIPLKKQILHVYKQERDSPILNLFMSQVVLANRNMSTATEVSKDSHNSRLHFRVVEVPGDGDCLYHAIIKGAKLEATPAELRHEVAKAVESDKDLFEDIVTEWWAYKVITVEEKDYMTPQMAARKIRNGEWGVSTDIHILATLLKLEIHVVKDEEAIPESLGRVQRFPYDKALYPWVKETFKPEKRIFILNRGKHYDLLEEKKDCRFKCDNNRDDTTFVKHSKDRCCVARLAFKFEPRAQSTPSKQPQPPRMSTPVPTIPIVHVPRISPPMQPQSQPIMVAPSQTKYIPQSQYIKPVFTRMENAPWYGTNIGHSLHLLNEVLQRGQMANVNSFNCHVDEVEKQFTACLTYIARLHKADARIEQKIASFEQFMKSGEMASDLVGRLNVLEGTMVSNDEIMTKVKHEVMCDIERRFEMLEGTGILDFADGSLGESLTTRMDKIEEAQWEVMDAGKDVTAYLDTVKGQQERALNEAIDKIEIDMKNYLQNQLDTHLGSPRRIDILIDEIENLRGDLMNLEKNVPMSGWSTLLKPLVDRICKLERDKVFRGDLMEEMGNIKSEMEKMKMEIAELKKFKETNHSAIQTKDIVVEEMNGRKRIRSVTPEVEIIRPSKKQRQPPKEAVDYPSIVRIAYDLPPQTAVSNIIVKDAVRGSRTLARELRDSDFLVDKKHVIKSKRCTLIAGEAIDVFRKALLKEYPEVHYGGQVYKGVT